jgi:hypothetical protein
VFVVTPVSVRQRNVPENDKSRLMGSSILIIGKRRVDL